MDKNISVDEAKQILAQHGYFTANLWHIDDVKSRYDCTDDEANEVLENALESEGTFNQIWFAIDHFASNLGLQKNS